MLNSAKNSKIIRSCLKLMIWLVVLIGVVIVQSGALRPVEVEASIEISAIVNDPVIEKVSPSSGPAAGDTRVNISGTNFNNVIAVTFGGVNVQSFTTESDSLISAIIPAGQPGAVKVVVITEDKAGALENGFTYLAAATPTSPPTSTATAAPSLPASTATVVGGTPTPSITTPLDGQPTASPGTHTGTGFTPTPTGVPFTVTNTPAATGSPQQTPPESPQPVTVPPESVTPVSGTTEPTTVPATTTAVLTPAATFTPTSSPVVNPTATMNVSPSPTIFPTPTPGNPTINPTATTTVNDEAPKTPVVSQRPSSTPNTANPNPSVSPVTFTVIPQTPVTGTANPTTAPTINPTAPATLAPENDPTPTAIVAPTASPTVSISPSQTPIVTVPPTITQVNPASGPMTGGTPVIIKGTNFTAGTQVTFGGMNPASVIFNNPTQLTVVTAPQQAGIFSIVVKSDFGLASLADGYTYSAESVVISQEPTNFNYSGKLNGKELTLKSSFSVGITTQGGNTKGWRLVASSTLLSSGTMVIPVANHTIQNVQVVTNSGTPTVNKVVYPLTFPVKNATIFSAEPDTGTGETIVTFETQLVIPPGLPAGNYKLTLNVEVIEGVG